MGLPLCLVLRPIEGAEKHHATLSASNSSWFCHLGNVEKMLHVLYLFYGNVGICLLLTSVILNVKPFRKFLVGFICPCFYFQFIMNSVFGKSLLYFAHLLFFAIIIIIIIVVVMLS